MGFTYRRVSVCVAASAVVVVALSSVLGQAQDATKIRTALLEAVTANKAELLKGTTAVWRSEQYVIKTDGEEAEKEFLGMCEAAYSGSRYAYKIFPSEEALRCKEADIDTRCDGSMVLTLKPNLAPRDADTARGSAIIANADDNVRNPWKESTHLLLLGYQASFGPEDLLRSDTAVADPLLHKVNGYDTYLVTSTDPYGHVWKYWFAPDLSGNPVRMEVYSKSGKLNKKMDYGDFQRQSDGIYLPTTVRRELFGLREDGAIDITLLTVHELQAGQPVDENLFKVDVASIPGDYYVSDQRFGLRYVQGQGPLGDAAVERVVRDVSDEIAAELGKADLLPEEDMPAELTTGSEAANETDIADSHSRGWLTPPYLVAAVCVLLLAVAALLLARARQRAK